MSQKQVHATIKYSDDHGEVTLVVSGVGRTMDTMRDLGDYVGGLVNKRISEMMVDFLPPDPTPTPVPAPVKPTKKTEPRKVGYPQEGP